MTPPPITPSRAAQARIGIRLRRRLAERRRYDDLDAEAQQAWLQDRLAKLRQHAVEHSRFYQQHHAGLDGAPIGELPIVTKADLVERFDEMVTDRRLRLADLQARLRDQPSGTGGTADRYRIATSSGSTGSPALLAFDESEWIGLIANAARTRGLAGRPNNGALKSAKIGSSSPWHLSFQVPATLQDPRKPSRAFSASDPIDETISALHAWQPSMLSAYPSVLRPLLAEQQAGNLSISPAQVFSTGEHLSAPTRELVREVWGIEVFDQYVATEAGFVAVECTAHGGLHVLDDHVLVEVVDASGDPCAPGQEGQVLITTLHSHTLPLIRYRLGDQATFAEGPCSCGRRGLRLASIAGADRDLLRFRSAAAGNARDTAGAGDVGGEGASGSEATVHPVSITAIVDRQPIGSWQVLHSLSVLRVLVAHPGPSFDHRATEAELADALDRAGVHREVAVEVEVVGSIAASSGGKAARFRAIDR